MEPIARNKVIDLRGVETGKRLPPKPSPTGPEDGPKPEPIKGGGVLYEWQAPEFTKYKKDRYWGIMLGIGALIVVVYFVFTKNYLGAVVIALLAVLIYIYAFKEPRTIHFAITQRGVTIEKKLHRFEDLKSFWIFYEPPELKELSIRGKKFLTSHIYLPLGKANPVEIRRILLQFIPEKRQEESIANILARRLRF